MLEVFRRCRVVDYCAEAAAEVLRPGGACAGCGGGGDPKVVAELAKGPLADAEVRPRRADFGICFGWLGEASAGE